MIRSIFTGGGAAILLAGCATADDLALREYPSFQVGYGDGCITSTEEDKSFSTKKSRDAHLFETDDAYRSGWRQGYMECASQLPEVHDGGRILGERDETL